ncbi:hypothetical protein LCGC14_0848200 [marine sediment metagenome]|uniref:Uncharacterized protein n=1 Tax=marine sediment metagenome TaxID=412755 RepID=A0A0F9PWD8_9ZZZZ
MKILSIVSARESITGIAILIKFLMIIISMKRLEGKKVACPLYSIIFRGAGGKAFDR